MGEKSSFKGGNLVLSFLVRLSFPQNAQKKAWRHVVCVLPFTILIGLLHPPPLKLVSGNFCQNERPLGFEAPWRVILRQPLRSNGKPRGSCQCPLALQDFGYHQAFAGLQAETPHSGPHHLGFFNVFYSNTQISRSWVQNALHLWTLHN